jgi:hypothetical protein
MFRKELFIALGLLVLAGCASVPTQDAAQSEKAKLFAAPSSGNAGLYIFRSGGLGAALKKDIWVDGECLGESAPNVFFFREVTGDKEHKISTESEFSPNDLAITTVSGKIYYVRQYIKFGVFVGGANLEVVDEDKARKEIAKMKLANPGSCSKPNPK